MSGSIPLAPPGTGMISSATPFVAPDLSPMPLSFRFLFELWKNSGDYARRLAVLEAKLGVTDGSDAAAGQIGEYLSATGSSGSLTTGVAVDLATLTLSAGDWDVTGSATFTPSVELAGAQAWLNTVAATPADPGRMVVAVAPGSGPTELGGTGILVGPVRYSIAAPSTVAVHLGVQTSFPSGTVSSNVWIRARRVR